MSNSTAAGTAHGSPSEVEFWRVYDDAVPVVYGYLLRRTNASIAEDLTQEVFMAAARAFGSGAAEKVTVAWLVAVAKTRLVDHYRREQRQRRKLVLAWSAHRPENAGSAEDSSDAQHLAAEVEAALSALSAPQRTALVLHYLDDQSIAEVAATLCRSVRATESLLARARAAFRTAMKEVSSDE